MKTEELQELGLNEDQIKGVFRLNGLDIKDYNKIKKENDTLKEDLDVFKERAETAEETLKGFEGKDYEKVSRDLEEWKQKYETDTAAYQKQIHDRDYADAIKEHVDGLQFTSESAKKAYVSELKAAELTMKDGKIYGLTDFLSAYKETDADAFVKDTKKPRTPESRLTQPLGDDSRLPAGEIDKAKFRKMSYTDRVKLKQSDPELYKQLNEGE